ncbi:unnamed protein product [Gadus morhua 'NCC']
MGVSQSKPGRCKGHSQQAQGPSQTTIFCDRPSNGCPFVLSLNFRIDSGGSDIGKLAEERDILCGHRVAQDALALPSIPPLAAGVSYSFALSAPVRSLPSPPPRPPTPQAHPLTHSPPPAHLSLRAGAARASCFHFIFSSVTAREIPDPGVPLHLGPGAMRDPLIPPAASFIASAGVTESQPGPCAVTGGPGGASSTGASTELRPWGIHPSSNINIPDTQRHPNPPTHTAGRRGHSPL